jgi:Eco57I restriction-modification methylase
MIAFLRLAERFADFEATNTKAHADKRLPPAIAQNATALDRLLAEITVCDPAIGSGAFPVGMMHEIVRARMALTPVLEKQTAGYDPGQRTPYSLKRRAIQHSLYGVDEDPGAVEIAKLRLWLSMIVDEEEIAEIQPLPNLDYKIMQGNSLLEEFDGVKLFDERLLQQQNEDQPNPRIAKIEERLRWVKEEMNRLQSSGRLTARMAASLKDEGARLARERKALLNPSAMHGADHPELGLGSRGSLNWLQRLHAEFFDEASRLKKDELRSELDKLEWNFMQATLREQGREEALVELERANARHRKPFFLWWLHFSEIKQRRDGFDVVIANPPYVRMELIKDQKPALKRRFPLLFSGRADLYVYFYGLGIDILRPAGCLTFISSNSYLNAKFGEKLRKYLSDVASVSTLIDFAETRVFDAVIEPAIMVLRKGTSEDTSVQVLKWKEEQPLDELPEVVAKHAVRLPRISFTADPWRLESSEILRLLDLLLSRSKPLGDYVDGDVLYGVKTGLNEAFVIDDETRHRLRADPLYNSDYDTIIKPFIRGRDIAKWTTRPITNWLIYTHHGVDISRYPLLEKHLLPFRKQLEKRATKQAWYQLQQPQFRYSRYFDRPKIIYQDIARYFGMAWDDTGAYVANTCY